jgi:hypothetical protein
MKTVTIPSVWVKKADWKKSNRQGIQKYRIEHVIDFGWVVDILKDDGHCVRLQALIVPEDDGIAPETLGYRTELEALGVYVAWCHNQQFKE